MYKSIDEYLKILYPNNEFVYNKAFPNYRFRPDYRCDELKIVVEFDGYQHYTKAKVILDDYKKQEICENCGYKVIRIPYFIQMCNELVQTVFSIHNIPIEQIFPHGFIVENSTMVYPADFCELGLDRFSRDINGLFYFAKEEIIKNLTDKCKKYDRQIIIPNSLYLKEKINANS